MPIDMDQTTLLTLQRSVKNKLAVLLTCFISTCMPGMSFAEIIWSGDYETGNFQQWHLRNNLNHPQFSGVPAYGRPVAQVPFSGSADTGYYGNGELLELVTSPVRQGRYAARFTVKNAINGSETADCDNGQCNRRRSELNMHLVHQPVYQALPYLSERWVSVSHYVPSDWDSSSGSSWGPTVFQIKSPRTNDISPMFSIIASNQGWQIYHRWSDVADPNDFDVLPWQYQMYYDATYPTTAQWEDGLRDFPDVADSRNALANLNKGGWTDWVVRISFDARGSAEGGAGFLTVWKRAGNAQWVQVLHITPKRTSRGGLTFDHGIGYEVPGSGFGLLAGMYMAKEQVSGLPTNRVLYNDNIKIGDTSSIFSDMSPDGSAPGGGEISDVLAPRPPVFTSN